MTPRERERNLDSMTHPTVEQPSADPSCTKALICARAAIDKKAENVKVLNLSQLSGFTDYFVICSGMSDRQVQAIADSIEGQLESEGGEILSIEGYGEGRWVL